MDPVLVLLGFLVGFVIGLTGVGGGSLMTPALILVFGIKPIVAVGTDLLYAALTKAGGVFVHNREKNIDWRVVLTMACGSVPASVCAIFLLKKLDTEGADYQGLVMGLLAGALILTALFLLFRRQLLNFSKHERFLLLKLLHAKHCTPMTVAAGAVIGLLVTLSSVGAGVIGAVFLLLLYPRLRPVQVVGTDLAHAVPITTIAGLGHVHLGTVDFILLSTLLLGSLPGIFLGSHVGTLLPDRVMRPLLAALLLLLGVRLLLQGH